MTLYKKLFKAGALIIGVLCLFAVLSFIKIWLNDKNSTSMALSRTEGVESITDAGQVIPESLQNPVKSSDSGPETDLVSEPTHELKLETINDTVSLDKPVIKPSSNLMEISILPQVGGKKQYHDLLMEFARSTLEPIGFSLCSDEYIAADGKDGSKNVVILYFTGASEASYEGKRLAAIRLAQFIYGYFEEQTGFRTDYLKVHLKQPEGDSFALERESYLKWVDAGGTEDELFDNFMLKMIQPVTIEQKPEGEMFQAEKLEKHLNGLNIPDLQFKVEGDVRVDPGIYIIMNKDKSDLSTEDYEKLVMQLCHEVFRAYFAQTGQPVKAYKLMEPSSNVVFVIYRQDVDILWPEGNSEELLQQFIRDGKTGPLS